MPQQGIRPVKSLGVSSRVRNWAQKSELDFCFGNLQNFPGEYGSLAFLSC